MVYMSEKVKRTLILLGGIAVFLAIFIVILGFYKEDEPEELVYPHHILTDSIFDSQNTVYSSYEKYTVAYPYSYCPYTVDTVDASGAVVEDASIFEVASEYYLVYQDVLKTADTVNELARVFSKVLLYDVALSDVQYYVLEQDTGFVNGFTAEYTLFKISVSNNSGTPYEAYGISYRFIVESSSDWIPKYDMVMAAISTDALSSAMLSMCESLMELDVYTIQYNSSMESTLLTDQRKKEEEVNAAYDQQNTKTESENIDEPSDDDTPVDDVQTKGILLESDFQAVDISVYWENTDVIPSVEMESPDGQNIYEPMVLEGGRAVFHLENAAQGVYVVTITGGSNGGTYTTSIAGS